MNKLKWFTLIGGLVIGVIAVILVKLGNPGNMGFCIACFERDIAGALGLHRAGVVQYIRPEIIGLILGAMIFALFKGEFRSRGGSATFLRFIMGAFMMIGALVFLGCPLRDILRMAGGDVNAVVAFIGFALGIATGVFFLKRGFDLGRSTNHDHQLGGFVLPAIFAFLLVLLLCATSFSEGGPIFFSQSGPGSMAAPVAISLIAGLLVGAIAQRIRLCLSGGIRDFILMRDNTLLLGFLGIFAGALVLNLIFGFFNFGFTIGGGAKPQPVAHTAQLWNFLGLYLVGLTACLLGGCPLRQLVLSGEGDTDAAAVVVGMIVGAAFAHNFAFASAASAINAETALLSIGGPGLYGQIACVVGIVFMLIVGFTHREKA
ncbi:MAG: YedE family putative selenium transporter [Syntrophomonadaceae bacterium]|nr:YedE family putative selenium transporter [Syntrophomonadaceae bacterium]